MADPVISAGSFAGLIALAEDPPATLQSNESGVVGRHLVPDSLVLYIARVPGSRDIFLSPLKPREKVVTAQDVESSLFYCHVVDEVDQDVFASSMDTIRPASASALKPEHRLDVASKHSQSSSDLPCLPLGASTTDGSHANGSPARSAGQDQVHRKPVPGSGPGEQSSTSKLHASASAKEPNATTVTWSSARKPAGPRPMQHRSRYRFADDPTASPSLDGSECMRSTYEEERYLSEQTVGLSLGGISKGQPPSPHSRKPLAPSFSAMLIRRDPSSGMQWDIGRVTIYGTRRNGSSPSRAASRSPGPNEGESGASIEIYTPSYSKFADTEPADRQLQQEGVKLDGESTCFRRWLALRPGPSRDPPVSTTSPSLLPSAQRPPSPTKSIFSSSSSTSASSFSVAFSSPWSGTCQFATGAAGRSLRCWHYPSGSAYPSSPSPSPHPQPQQHEHWSPMPAPPALTSELRFNLPLARKQRQQHQRRDAKKTTSSSSSPPKHRFPKLHHYRHRSHERASGDDDYSSHDPGSGYREENILDEFDDYEDGADGNENEPMDLSLGQERAGGGLLGNKAKLGKLLLHRESLPMLDLVVAANMGIFWWSMMS